MRRSLLLVMAIVVATVGAACGPDDASELTGMDWHLVSITEKTPAYQGVVPAEDQGRFTIQFGEDGSILAQADCNKVAGTYTTTNRGGLTITIGVSTLAACGPRLVLGLVYARVEQRRVLRHRG